MNLIPLSEWVDELESGARPKGGIKDGVGDIPSLGAEHLSNDGGFNFEKVKLIPFSFYERMKKGRITQNDILIVKDGATTGKVSFVNGTFPYTDAAINEHVFRLSVNRKKADPGFVFRYLQSPAGQAGIMSDFRGATVGGIGRTFVDKVLVPEVDPSEQRRIASILDKADAIRRNREQVLALSDDLLKSTFLEMFPSGRDSECQLSEVVADDTIVTYGIVQAGPEHAGGVPYIRTGDIKNGKIVTENLRHTSPEIASKFLRSRVRAGEIVMSIRATVGTTAVVPPELDGANLTQGTARISPGKSVTLEYLLHYLRSEQCQRWIQNQVKGATFREITLTRLREMPVPIPDFSQQEAFSSFVQASTGTLKKLENDLETANSMFAALSQRAFRGEL